jgi:hypothetical protein
LLLHGLGLLHHLPLDKVVVLHVLDRLGLCHHLLSLGLLLSLHLSGIHRGSHGLSTHLDLSLLLRHHLLGLSHVSLCHLVGLGLLLHVKRLGLVNLLLSELLLHLNGALGNRLLDLSELVLLHVRRRVRIHRLTSFLLDKRLSYRLLHLLAHYLGLLD